MTVPLLLPLLGMCATVLVGALAQRSTGMGFALLSAPFLMLVLGPFEGILVANVCGAVSSAINLVALRADVDRSRAAVLVPMGVVGVVPGAIAVLLIPEAPLMVAVSAVVIAGLALTLLLRGRTLPQSRALGAAGGLASGFMNVPAGVGGPGVVIYAAATGWAHRGFAATAQLQFLVLGIVSLAAKGALPSLDPFSWVALLAALLVGTIAGSRLAPRLPPERAMRIVLVLAVAGSLLALGRGLALLL
jgi:uncharacterized membrane protein YfcA